MAVLESYARGYGSPSKYVQGPGEFKNIKKYASAFGKNVFVLVDGFLYTEVKDRILNMYRGDNGYLDIYKFGGEVCVEEIEKILSHLQNRKIDVVIGIGGGKTIDTSKVVAEEIGATTIIVPTAASTDAPTSAVSVIYKQTGEHSHEAFLRENPEIVLVDTEIVMDAPVRLLIAGMGDALATFFEARACLESRSPNFIGGGYKPTRAGLAIGRVCYETLLEDGLKAKHAAENKVYSEAFENIVEANTLLSGLGFESTGCAAAHGIHDAFTELPETSSYYHGEKVAFGTICLLFLENRSMDEIEEVVSFCKRVGLPTTLAEIGVTDCSKEHLMPVAIKASESNLVKAEPVHITPEIIFGAIILADEYGRSFQ